MTDLSQGGFRPDAPDFGGLLRQQPGLVEAPGVVPPPADGHKGHRVELSAQPLRRRLSQIAGKDSGPPGFFAELEGADPLLDHPVVVERYNAGAASLPDGGQLRRRLPEGKPGLAVSADVPRLLQKGAAEGAPGREEEIEEGRPYDSGGLPM